MNSLASVSSPLVSVENLSVALAGRDVVRNVSFSIPAGGALALVGESGSGKTVTARVLTGLLSRIGGVVTAGSAKFDGIDLAHADAPTWRRLRGRRIALVPQASLSSLDPVISIGNQLIETIRELDPEANASARAIELLEQVQLPRPAALMRSYPHELSGGMRQRLMIALALAGRPEFIIADEPTTALDVTVQRGVLRLITELRRETGMTLLIIAHDLAVVQMVAEDVAVMRSGELVETGAAGTVLTRPVHGYTQALLAARPESAAPGTALAVLDRENGELHRREIPRFAMKAERQPLIVAQEVTVTYRGAISPALTPVSLTIARGDAVGIVGESGSGKSTLGRVLVGAQPPSTGSVTVEGRAWEKVRASDALRGRVQMIFQDPYASLTPWRTPRQIVAEVLSRWRKLSRVEALDAAGGLLDEVGLPLQAMDRRPEGLSGGQCQRVGIARALASNPEVIIADEPTSSLDISAQAQILNLLLRLRSERDLALVLISHDLAVIRHMTDSALVMRNGTVVEQGASEQIFSSPSHDYTRELVASTPTLGRQAA
jgi:peptide/nickel transport system ATP-binding protein